MLGCRGDESVLKKFVQVSEAYEALSNSETRRIYDQYGHEGLEQHRQGGGAARHHDPFDLFSRFFGGGGHFGHGGGQRRGPNMEATVQIPLRDFYNGVDTDIHVEKQTICEQCEGTGSADGQVDTCDQCGGRGVVIQKHMLAPGIFQQVQSMCGLCGGSGKSIRHPCHACAGSKVVRKVTTHSLHVDPGMPKGVRLNFENEADESPDWVAGDLIVKLVEKTPTLGGRSSSSSREKANDDDDDDDDDEEMDRADGTFFRRKGIDLFWTEVLSLREAWLGDWTRNITHLDGHVVRLSRPRGQVVQPSAVEVLKGEGMPIWSEDPHRPPPPKGVNSKHHAFGALHVTYLVVLPDQMNPTMEKDIWTVWDQWHRKVGVDLATDSGGRRPRSSINPDSSISKDEL